MEIIRKNRTILGILLAGFLLRVILSFFGTLELDFNTFIAWSNRLNQVKLNLFYQAWSDYLPGYLYILWFLGFIKNTFSFLPLTLIYKLPAILADITTGYLIYLIVRKFKKEKIALIATLFYIFNPAILANSTLWGQVDSLTALFSMLAIYFTGINPWFSAFFLAYGTSIKLQAAIAAFVILFIMLRDRWSKERIFKYIVLGFFVFTVTFIPFSPGNVFSFIYERITTTLNQYPYTSINAFNFWGLGGLWNKDGQITNFLGIAVTLCLGLFSAKKLWKVKNGEYLLAAVLFAGNFLFFTRMHERHLLPVLAPLIVSTGQSFLIWVVYFLFSTTYIVNLIYSHVWISDDFREVISPGVIKTMIVVNLASLAILLNSLVKKSGDFLEYTLNDFLKAKTKMKKVDKKSYGFEKVKLPLKRVRLMLFVILTFSLISRLLYLNKPNNEYFDEVYHAFTARLVLHNDPKAWEWWNPHPEGFAYEWTHPPLAKEGMALGMLVFGENSFGWRFPGALLGVGSVFLVYLLAKELFKDEAVGLISSALFSLDGLPLVMSRIGMNDSYLLFFILLSFYLYIKDKNFLSALAFGLAASSKWSAIWAIPIFVVSHFVLKKRFKPSYLWYLVLPPLVYLASYTPMFLTGHNFDIFIGVQKQMWWYHTQLKATHPYTSQWWSWPLLLRPIWLYTSGSIKGLISNIYAMGNPLVFWFGIASIFYSLYFSFVYKDKTLALIVFSYLIFFVPWAASPRIMFLYHYLPSIPFMAIASGYVLRRNPKYSILLLVLGFLVFVYFFSHWTGLPITDSWDKSYYWFNSWR